MCCTRRRNKNLQFRDSSPRSFCQVWRQSKANSIFISFEFNILVKWFGKLFGRRLLQTHKTESGSMSRTWKVGAVFLIKFASSQANFSKLIDSSWNFFHFSRNKAMNEARSSCLTFWNAQCHVDLCKCILHQKLWNEKPPPQPFSMPRH